MARAVKKASSRKAPATAAQRQLPQITAAVSPEFRDAAKAYAAKNGLNISQLVVSAVAEKIGGKVKDSVNRRQRNIAA